MSTQRQPSSMLIKKASLICCVICCVLFLSIPRDAHAMGLYAHYAHSDPAINAHLPSGDSPVAVQVWFTERIEPKFSHVEVYDQDGERIDRHDSKVGSDGASLRVSLLAGLIDGTYTVVYHNISQEDGHMVFGNFNFVVGGGYRPGRQRLTLLRFLILTVILTFGALA
ncbi:copper resistance CopC family protein [Dictyobacter kobayashii]|uniref:CopC domain-containing protein n=1 Tax=Dictyobacter kobayashii TaxID=2014872 RepID=A0A402AIZ3_9CHLR|nr:copper resistance CopC family protein [Dictyobacter kobayashii]GCE19092.1 hypothetical protein KDK_28920 [Dictyobacter kobayashii]